LSIDLWGGVSQRLFRVVDREGRLVLSGAGRCWWPANRLVKCRMRCSGVLRGRNSGMFKPGLVPLRDRSAAKAQRNAVAIGPIGHLAGNHHCACVAFARNPNRNLEIDLLAQVIAAALNGNEPAIARAVGVSRDRRQA